MCLTCAVRMFAVSLALLPQTNRFYGQKHFHWHLAKRENRLLKSMRAAVTEQTHIYVPCTRRANRQHRQLSMLCQSEHTYLFAHFRIFDRPASALRSRVQPRILEFTHLVMDYIIILNVLHFRYKKLLSTPCDAHFAFRTGYMNIEHWTMRTRVKLT